MEHLSSVAVVGMAVALCLSAIDPLLPNAAVRGLLAVALSVGGTVLMGHGWGPGPVAVVSLASAFAALAIPLVLEAATTRVIPQRRS